MRYAGIIKNDLAAAPGVCTTLFVQGCPIHCPGCHNPESWDFNGGELFEEEAYKKLKEAIQANGFTRTFCIMGGEPLAKNNYEAIDALISRIKQDIPDLKIWIWSGYNFKDLELIKDISLKRIFYNINAIVTGPFIQDKRDITLRFRGSSNQEIWIKNSEGVYTRQES